MNPSLQSLRAFRAVGELGSFAAAARQLEVTGSAVTKLVAGLESQLGVRLLQRSTRKVSLTAAGEGFLLDCVQLLEEAEAAFARVQSQGQTVRGLLRLSVPSSFALRWLQPRLPAFLREHRELQLDLQLTDRYVDLVAERLDAAIRIGTQLPDSSLHARALGRVPRVLVAAPAYLASSPPLRGPADLTRHNALVFALSSTGSDWPFMLHGRPINVAVRGQLRADNSVMLRELLRSGLGIALTPHFIVDDLLANGELSSLLSDCMPAPLTVHAVSTQRRQPLLRTQLIVDFLARELAASGYGLS
ncbi:LysR family transcriptional regulator [Roseateles sp. LYH14W]|uniref:LysR family transcriptional regulator n=1 Tax=Pelomonas parva TaxID=3299032 RepID=A0ABW7FB10_9BURK